MNVRGSILAAWIASVLVSFAALLGLSALTDPPLPGAVQEHLEMIRDQQVRGAFGHPGAPEYSLRYEESYPWP